MKTLLHSVYEQHDAAGVHAQFNQVLDALADKQPRVADDLEAAQEDIPAFTPFTRGLWRRSGRTVRRNPSTGEAAASPTWSGFSPTAPR
ncbi:transposase-like protein [Arthrobacter sp. MP_M7]|nr:transposase-like protein [Arthrobacter sp. MP_M4]MEC5202373.1 transposase-like protein [Arthrobacter sp. MP_M7]